MSRNVWLLMGVGLALSACVGNGDQDSSLVRVEAEPQGANCKYGGTVIHTGLDTNHNTKLDTSEITSSSYICDAATTVKCDVVGNNLVGPVSLRTVADFAPLSDVNCIDGDLMIVGSDLATLPALPNLEIVTGSVIIAGNSALTSVDGLPNVHQVGRKYVLQGNDSLVDISAVGGLQRFQAIAITGNDGLIDLAGLETFTEIDGGLAVMNNSNLTSLHGLENLTRNQREAIIVRSNKSLTSVAALANLRSTPLLEISGNASLPSAPFASLEKVDVYVLVKDNAALTTLELPALLTTGGLILQTNPQLTSVAAPELVLTGSFTAESDLALTTINAPKLSYTTVNFDLVNLPQLTSAIFSSMVAIGGPVQMYLLPKLTSFAGFSQLGSIGGNLTVRACNGLSDFSGLGNLVDVANMTITQNSQLSSFTGLTSFTRVGGDLVISENPSLQLATAQAFATSITVSGTVTIN